MRQLLAISCEGQWLGASLDDADGETAVLIVTGGTQTRIGSHRMFERLGAEFARAGYPCLRFDRRGVGDSGGSDPDFTGNASDMVAAADALRERCPQVRRVIGFGLCDGATSLALFAAQAKLAGLILVNPWLVEAKAGQPPPAAIRDHYRRRLLSLEGWKKILTGAVSYRKLLAGIMKIVRRRGPQQLADAVAQAMGTSRLPVALVLAREDATAVVAREIWNSAPFRTRAGERAVGTWEIDSDSHTFSRPGDMASLSEACFGALARLERSGRD